MCLFRRQCEGNALGSVCPCECPGEECEGNAFGSVCPCVCPGEECEGNALGSVCVSIPERSARVMHWGLSVCLSRRAVRG